ncbi:hypothetical protein EV102420_07_01880 [Pseudescherichia vulneris NBRC 102420]|uniref:Uncharacterized protein n=1 Tax=Pseudescherichia vulneris NBRC 102420 TaxID=1115515 RepID=A0A090UZR3_PSEVU|nr:hypothetical protein [Pseudescherichia vulneris]GAL57368.1 hypothetical protein EV102420_07_01880 [Pseudescherichia vulneris NBRC 102420]
MSWDNVTSVYSVKIWTDNPDTTQAYLFANGNHQVKLTIRLVFNIIDANQPGPTQDECKAAVSLVDYQTGADLSFLKVGDKGAYTYVYQENRPTEVKPLPEEDNPTATSPKSGSYEFDLYVSSDSTINANYASENVALFISFIDASGTEIKYNTTSTGKPSYVAVKVYPPKKYGMAQSNVTPIILYEHDSNPHYTIDNYDMVTTDDVKYLIIYALRIDDPYFKITHFETPGTALSPSAFRQIIISNDSSASKYVYHLVQGYLPTENNVNRKGNSYTTRLGISAYSSNSTANVAEYYVDVYQMPGVIIFANVEVDIKWEVSGAAGDLVKSSDSAKLTVFDQFGNHANVEVGAGNDYALTISSVT